MHGFFLTQILEKKQSAQDTIIDILQARGFLIEKYNDKYYLSDNATVNDAEYLADGFKRYGLGYVINNKEYIISRRTDWQNAPFLLYSYYSLQPLKVEIVISNTALIDSAVDFFMETKQFSEECSGCSRSWAQYTIERLGTKANVRELEPYVAYYVKAISSCGVYTFRSCDGNHPNGGKIYVEVDYPSNILHENIWSYIIQPRYGNIPYIGTGIHFSSSNQQDVYKKIYEIADYLYQNRLRIRGLKLLSVMNINKKFIKTHSEEEIEAFYKEECKELLHQYQDSFR